MPIWPDDFLRMKFSFKVDHTICSEEDITRINHLIENRKIEDIPIEVNKIHDRLLYLLTETVYLWAGKDDIGLYAIEASSKIFSREFRDNNASRPGSQNQRFKEEQRGVRMYKQLAQYTTFIYY